MKTYKFHPLADLFPLMRGSDFAALLGDIQSNGLREKIVLYQGKILDGRNRYRACRKAAVACRFVKYSGKQPPVLALKANGKIGSRSLRTPSSVPNEAPTHLACPCLALFPRSDWPAKPACADAA
jgi:hypothetical protein